jgi:hypothetical protein
MLAQDQVIEPLAQHVLARQPGQGVGRLRPGGEPTGRDAGGHATSWARPAPATPQQGHRGQLRQPPPMARPWPATASAAGPGADAAAGHHQPACGQPISGAGRPTPNPVSQASAAYTGRPARAGSDAAPAPRPGPAAGPAPEAEQPRVPPRRQGGTGQPGREPQHQTQRHPLQAGPQSSFRPPRAGHRYSPSPLQASAAPAMARPVPAKYGRLSCHRPGPGPAPATAPARRTPRPRPDAAAGPGARRPGAPRAARPARPAQGSPRSGRPGSGRVPGARQKPAGHGQAASSPGGAAPASAPAQRPSASGQYRTARCSPAWPSVSTTSRGASTAGSSRASQCTRPPGGPCPAARHARPPRRQSGP